MSNPTPLATVEITGMTEAKMEAVILAAEHEFGGSNLQVLNGTIKEHGGVANYKFDGSNVLTLDIIKVPSIFGHKLMTIEEFQSAVLGWIETTVKNYENALLPPVKTEEVMPEVPANPPATLSDGKMHVPVVTTEKVSEVKTDPVTQQPTTTQSVPVVTTEVK